MGNNDYMFYINWEDNMKNIRNVGYLAYINDFFYLLIRGNKNIETAYKNGFIGIPGFKVDEIYRSSELFDFFRDRILDKDSKSPYDALISNEGKSMIDSFSLSKVPEIMVKKKMINLLEAYQIQEKRKEIDRKKEPLK